MNLVDILSNFEISISNLTQYIQTQERKKKRWRKERYSTQSNGPARKRRKPQASRCDKNLSRGGGTSLPRLSFYLCIFQFRSKRRPSVETADCGREIGKPNGIAGQELTDYSIALNVQPIRFADSRYTTTNRAVVMEHRFR